MKSLLPFFAFIILFRPFWPIVEYIVAYDYIVAELCENKDRPELGCDGTCYLSKQLAKELQQESNNPLKGNAAKQDIPQVLILEDFLEFNFQLLEDSASGKTYYQKKLHTFSIVFDILDPPQLG